jgi:hypothetical protein
MEAHPAELELLFCLFNLLLELLVSLSLLSIILSLQPLLLCYKASDRMQRTVAAKLFQPSTTLWTYYPVRTHVAEVGCAGIEDREELQMYGLYVITIASTHRSAVERRVALTFGLYL